MPLDTLSEVKLVANAEVNLVANAEMKVVANAQVKFVANPAMKLLTNPAMKLLTNPEILQILHFSGKNHQCATNLCVRVCVTKKGIKRYRSVCDKRM